MDEYIHELLTYCWNLEEENKSLNRDLLFYSRQTQLRHSPESISTKLEEKEYSLLLGRLLQEDIKDYDGNIIVEKDTIITSSMIESLISKGLYGELVSAADIFKGVEGDG